MVVAVHRALRQRFGDRQAQRRILEPLDIHFGRELRV